MSIDNKNAAPVGVFDSGVGGLTVARKSCVSFRMRIWYILGIPHVCRTEVNRETISFAIPDRLSIS